MPRYGGGKESFGAERAQLDAMAAKLAEIEAKEAQAAAAMNDLGAAADQATARRTVLNRAKREGTEITARETAVANEEAAAIDVNTASIERNRIARERRAAAARQESVNVQRAFRGAQDPLFAQAAAPGAPTSQYGLRRELGIGQGRAQRLQEAVALGITPGNPGLNRQPYSPTDIARIGLTRSEAELSQANKALAAMTRGAVTATDAEIIAARDRVSAAKESVAASRVELQSVEQLAAARREATIATARAAEAETVAGRPGEGLIVRDPSVPTRGGGRQAYAGVRTTKEAVEQGITPSLQAQQATAAAAAERRAAEASAVRADMAAKEAAALSGLTAGERAYVGSLSAEEKTAVLANRERAASATAQLTARTATYNGALQREGAALGSVSQAMYKHGALTQEFVLAAARGEVTLRELGNQALVTAGKFGGWTAAATAVFGVARALGAVVHGAVQAQSAQANLSRFIPGQTQDQTSQGLINVSREVNAPVEDVSTTQQSFARVFHNQADSLLATSTALKAYKLDQIDAADSTRYFTAITQEFGLNARQLPGLFDQISAAQRHMGARVAENLPAIARSAAAVRNAGGDLTQLVALTATAQVSTGQTGNVVGTAFSRAASNFSRKPANQKIIESFGIDANQSFTQMLIDAVRRSQTLNGAQRTELAKAIGGPQYGGRIFQSLLGQQDRLTRAREIVDPTNAAGSANEELRKKLSGADEMVKRLGTDLQQLGVALGQTGAFNFAGLFLKGADTLLHTVNELVGLFNQIPQPLREGVAMLGEMAVAVKLLQRFAPASLLNSGVGRAIGGPELGIRQRALRGLRDTQTGLRNEAEGTARRSFTTQRAASTAELQAQRALAEREAAVAAAATEGTAASGERVAVAEARLVRANADAASLAAKATIAAQEAADTAALAAAADAEYAAAKKMSTAELKAANAYAAEELGVPSYRGVARTGDGQPRTGPNGTLIAPGARGAVGEHGPDTTSAARSLETNAAREASVVEGRAAAMTTAVANWGTSWRAGAGNLERTSVVGARAVTGAVGVVEKSATTAIAAGAATASRIGGLGTSLRGFAAALGPLDIALGVFIGAELVDSASKKLNRQLEQAREKLKTPHAGPGALEALQRQHDELVDRGKFTANHLSDSAQTLNDFANPLHTFGNVARVIGGSYKSAFDRRDDALKENEAQQRDLARIQREQAAASAADLPLPELTYGQLRGRVEADAKLRTAGVISQREFDRRMAQHAVEVTELFRPSKGDLENAYNVLADANRRSPSTRNFASTLGTLNGKGLKAQADAIVSTITDFGGSKSDFTRLAEVYRAQAGYYSGGSSTGIAALSAARDAYYKAITGDAQTELQQATRPGSSEEGRQAAFERIAAQYRARLTTPVKSHLAELQARLAKQRESLATSRGFLQTADSGGALQTTPDNTFGIGGLGQIPSGTIGNSLRSAIAATRERVREIKTAIGNTNKEVRAAERELGLLMADLKDQSYQDRAASRQTDAALAASRTPLDPAAQGRAAAAAAAAQAADARKTYGPKSDAYKQAVTALNEANNGVSSAIQQQASQLIQAETALAEAQAGNDPLAQAQAAATGARRLLGVARTQVDRINAQAQLVAANNQAAQAARDLAVARYTYLASLTRDPVAQARIEEQGAQQAIAGTTGAARYQALADANNKRNAAIDAMNDVIQARYTYLESLTRDPVKQARIELQGAAADVRNANGAAARFRAQAALNEKRHGLIDARLQSREDDIQFGLDMDRLSTDAAISQYRSLLKTKGITKEARRNILRQIKQLQDGDPSSANLNVGNIKLPTVYEVKRLARQGTNSAPMSVQSNYNYNITVSNPDDIEALGAMIDSHTGGATRAAMRSAGQR